MIIELQLIAAHFSRYKTFSGNPYLAALIDMARTKRLGGQAPGVKQEELDRFDRECISLDVFNNSGNISGIPTLNVKPVDPGDLMASYQLQQDERRAQNLASNRNMVRQAKQREAQGGLPLGDVPALTPQEMAAAAASPTADHAAQHRLSIGDLLGKANSPRKEALGKLHSKREERVNEAANLPQLPDADAWPEGAGPAPAVDPAIGAEPEIFTDSTFPVEEADPDALSIGGSPDSGVDEAPGSESGDETPLDVKKHHIDPAIAKLLNMDEPIDLPG